MVLLTLVCALSGLTELSCRDRHFGLTPIRSRMLPCASGSPLRSTPLSIPHLTGIFIGAVKDSLLASCLESPSSIGPHQRRKLAASLSLAVGQDEELVRTNMGFSSLTILRKNYVSRVPELRHSCVLPGGPFLFNDNNQLSDSE